MLLGEILHRGTIQPALAATEKYAIIDELLDLLIDAKDLPPHLREPVREALVAREKSMSTGMEDGVALPHGSSDRIQNIVGALGVSKEGVDFGCLDCKPAKLILLLVLPRDEFHVHVRTLAGISHLLNEPRFRESLLAQDDPDAILKLIRSEERGSVFDPFRRFK